MMQERKYRNLWCCTIVLALAVIFGTQPSPAWATPPTVTACQGGVNEADSQISGSGACAIGTFTTGTSRITHEEIWINNTRIWYADATPLPCGGWSIPGVWCAGYSTTAWYDGSSLVVTAKCWTEDGLGPFTAPSSPAYAYNKGYLMRNQSLYYGSAMLSSVNPKLDQMDHSTYCTGTYSWTDIVGSAGNWGGHLLANTVAFFYTHGGTDKKTGAVCDVLLDCLDHTDNVCCAPYIANATNEKTTEHFPYFNFVHVNACYSGDSTLFGAFHTTSYLGWTGWANDSQQNYNWTNAFWSGLSGQMHVAEARYYAFTVESTIDNDSGWGNQSYKVYRVTPAV